MLKISYSCKFDIGSQLSIFNIIFLENYAGKDNKIIYSSDFSSSCIRTLGVYMFQMLVGYILMCAIMTFNGYIFFATVGGYGLGYWLFGLTMMHLSAKNLLKSQDNPIRCKNCTRININSKCFKYHHSSLII